MSRSTSNKPAAAGKSGSSLLTGILLGMVIGVALAAGLAWYIMKAPSPFVQKEQAARPPLAVEKSEASAVIGNANFPPVAPASGVVDGKPRFEFYQVLTDKQDGNLPAQNKPVDKAAVGNSVPAATGEPRFLQAGAFSNADDAEKLKARLAFLGMQASIQVAAIPNKGVWHRVRLGPYKNAEELSSAQSLLKQNGVFATPIRAQSN